jgi:hypothetical protein
MAKKSGQMAIFKNKSGQRILIKFGQKWSFLAYFGLFLMVFGTFLGFVKCSWPNAHFFSYLIVN